jgi:hypothetical protein
MDDILNEEFPFFDQEFPFWLDGKDYSNRPGKHALIDFASFLLYFILGQLLTHVSVCD